MPVAGGQNFPQDYDVIQRLHDDGELTVRIAYNLFAQKPGEELSDYERWIAMTEPGAGDAMLRMNGAGENLTWSAADFENFLEPRPDPAPVMESELEPIVELLATNKWPFRIHATYDETIDRFLTVFERVNGRQPFETRFIIDHAETISVRNIERVKAIGRWYRDTAPHGVPRRVFRRALWRRGGQGDAADRPHAVDGCAGRRPAPTRRVSPPMIPGSAFTG